MYVMGVDAGGTKTRCMICDEKEHIVGRGEAGAAQHQMYGIAQTKENLTLAVERALTQAKLCLSDISYAVLGMSGADGEDDFALLIPTVGEVLLDVPYEVLHDSWIGLRAALGGAAEGPTESGAAEGSAAGEPTESGAAEGRTADGCPAGNGERKGVIEGVVSICGTGAAHAGMNGRGERLTLRNLDYITGNCGGGAELCERALHYAFRSEEGTYDKSLLEELIPPVFGVKTMEEVCGLIKNDGPNEKQRYSIPIVVFEAAKRGDAVAAKLLSDMGREEGRYAAAVIKRLEMTEKKVPVVLIGSLFQTGERLLIDAYMEQVHRAAPQAYPVILKEEPVLGAVRFALDKMVR
ncbi:MAG: hypothetical protein K2N41_00870 [Lachnospiraceae bacterium]|nr:hypothetical protein [Lachnospiraceae bacterium]